MLNTRGRGAGLNVRFAGNEPPWPVSAPEPYEAHQIKRAIDKCTADLRRKAATYYPADGNAAGTAPTSPFADEAKPQAKPDQDTTAQQPPLQPNANPRRAGWSFSEGEEEGVSICFAATTEGDASVGFIGQPGRAVSGFVAGVFDKETRATWTVDGSVVGTSSGTLDAYFEWTTFQELPATILDDIVGGQKLSIAEFGGKGTAVSLLGARDPIISFKKCLAKR